MNFFAYLNRMKFIKRWGLMRNGCDENVMEHSHQTAVIAHTLAVINNKIYGKNVNIERTVLFALYHEAGEVLTGDLPTPVKYLNNQISGAYKDLEALACKKLLKMLPDELEGEYENLLLPDVNSYEYKIVKYADKICAYIKCIEEVSCGNNEFKKAKSSIEKELKSINDYGVKYFLDNFIKSFSLSLDELE